MSNGFWECQGGHTLQVARKKCIAKSCIFVKNSNTGQRITHSRCDFIRRGGDLCLCMDAINAVEKTGGGRGTKQMLR